MSSRTDPAAASEGGVFVPRKTEVMYLLVVHDNAIEAAHLREALLANRCACDFVGSLADAVRAFTARDYDLILLSSRSTTGQVVQTIRDIRALERGLPEPRVPLFVFSGDVLLAESSRIKEAGADDVVSRSDDFAALFGVIERAVSIERRTPPELISREVFNFANLLDRCGGDAALAWQQISEFKELLHWAVAEFEEKLKMNDPALMRKVAEVLRLAAIDLKSGRVQRTAYLATKLDRIPPGQFAERASELIFDLKNEARDLDAWIELGLGQIIIGSPIGPMPAQSPLAHSDNFLRRMDQAGSSWPNRTPAGGASP